jgi:hypothetical protein
MNDQYQTDHVNTFEENHYQPERVNSAEPEPYQPDQVNTLENNRFYDKPLETQPVTAEPVQEADSLPEKTEPWKQTFAPVPIFTPIPTPTPTPVLTPEPAVPAVVSAASTEMLFGSEETQNFRARWNEVQAKFVDEPGCSVREADALVADVMAQITEMFAGQRQTLESQWSKDDTSTEDLRQVLQHYRAFFNRLLK